MCLLIKKSDKILEATENIVCYKILEKFNKKYRTPFMEKYVQIRKTYHSEITTNIYGDMDMINLGLHSFKSLDGVKLYQEDNDIIVKCIIPKGSQYYLGTFGSSSTRSAESYASDTLTYVEIIKNK